MTRLSRFLVSGASLSLLALFVVPLWRINLRAPQYPEGLGMHIWVNSVRGIGEHDLRNINELNHYIGMKAIDPGAIPELRVMPMVVIALAVLGLVTALVARRALLYAWGTAFVLAASLGMVDFQRWLHDYGHDLAPDAAIKVPGMSYQPPLIGTRQILNFTAVSWPAGGGWIAILAGVVVGLVMLHELREWRSPRAGAA
jgi:hypothetical protein